MEDITKEYTNGEITIVWQPKKCIHSAVCKNGLIEVFNPQVRPWINIQGAMVQKKLKTMHICVVADNQKINHFAMEHTKNVDSKMSNLRIISNAFKEFFFLSS